MRNLILSYVIGPVVAATTFFAAAAQARNGHELAREDCHIYLLTGDEYLGYAKEFVEALQERGYTPIIKDKGDFINESEKGDLVFLFDRAIELRSGLVPNEAYLVVGLREVTDKVKTDSPLIVGDQLVEHRLDYGEVKWANQSQWFYGDRVDTTRSIKRAISEFPLCSLK